MTKITTNTKAEIWGSKNAWSLSKDSGYSSSVPNCNVVLEINGEEKNGYHFIMMAPEGFFTADTWHETQQEALDEGLRLFGVNHSEWNQKEE